MIKLIAIDLDGTLLNAQKEVSQANRQALAYAKSKGVKVVLCTGRPYFAMKHFLADLGLVDPEDYIVTFNGGMVQKAQDGQLLVSNTLGTSDVLAWYQVTQDLDLPINVIDADRLYEPTAYPAGYPSLYLENVTNVPSVVQDYRTFDPDHAFNKFVIVTTQEHLDAQIPKLDPDFKDQYAVFKSRSFFLEVMKKGVSKGDTLAKLGELLDISPQEMMTMGDQENDLSMIELAGLGVAMGNATEQVKEAAQYVSLTNEEDGVAHAIHKFIV